MPASFNIAGVRLLGPVFSQCKCNNAMMRTFLSKVHSVKFLDFFFFRCLPLNVWNNGHQWNCSKGRTFSLRCKCARKLAPVAAFCSLAWTMNQALWILLGDFALEAAVDGDPASVVQLDAHALQAQAAGEGPAADAHQQHVARQRVVLAAGCSFDPVRAHGLTRHMRTLCVHTPHHFHPYQQLHTAINLALQLAVIKHNVCPFAS